MTRTAYSILEYGRRSVGSYWVPHAAGLFRKKTTLMVDDLHDVCTFDSLTPMYHNIGAGEVPAFVLLNKSLKTTPPTQSYVPFAMVRLGASYWPASQSPEKLDTGTGEDATSSRLGSRGNASGGAVKQKKLTREVVAKKTSEKHYKTLVFKRQLRFSVTTPPP